MSVIAKLREQEKTLACELENKMKTKENLLSKQKSIDGQLDNMHRELDTLETEYRSLAKKKVSDVRKIEMLRSSLEAYKEEAKKAERKLLVEEYGKALDDISRMDFDINPRIFDCFKMLRSMESAKFKNMRKKAREKYNAERTVLKQRLEQEVSSHMRAGSGLHKAFLYLNYMKRYEVFFGEDVFTSYFFGDLTDKFTYHFLSGKETNRLDKPEWMFGFLYGKYEEYSRFFDAFSKPFDVFLRKSEEVIGVKIRELRGCSSEQKKSLVWHFADEFASFSSSVFERYGYALNSTGVCAMLLESEHNYVEEALVKVYDMEYSRWYKEYKNLVEETLYFYRRYKGLDYRTLGVFTHLVDKIVESCSIFIDQMRFISKEEIRVLCCFYSEMEKLKSRVSEEEADIFLQCAGEAEVNMIQQANAKIVKFNQHNLNLLKLLVENDALKLLRRIKNFSYTQESDLVSFVIDMTQALQNYESCISYPVLLSHVQKKVDRFLVDQVILRHKLSSEHYLRFIDFFGRVEGIFGVEHWETSACIKCVECVFSGDGFDENPLLFKAISELYSR